VFSGLETTGETAAMPGTLSLEAKPGGCLWSLRGLGVTLMSEPTVSLASAAFAAS